MKTLILLSITFASLTFGKEGFQLIQTKELDTWLNSETKPAVFDANNEKVRKEYGAIPGAKLLESSSKYNVETELPKDKATQLVFYCANKKCTASHNAADRAIENGYPKVAVFSDGIQGWVKAGKKTTKVE